MATRPRGLQSAATRRQRLLLAPRSTPKNSAWSAEACRAALAVVGVAVRAAKPSAATEPSSRRRRALVDRYRCCRCRWRPLSPAPWLGSLGQPALHKLIWCRGLRGSPSLLSGSSKWCFSQRIAVVTGVCGCTRRFQTRLQVGLVSLSASSPLRRRFCTNNFALLSYFSTRILQHNSWTWLLVC